MINLKPRFELGQDRRDLPTYGIPEAALILHMPERTLRLWFSAEVGILKAAGYARGFPLLSFLDLVDAHIVSVARRHHRLSMRSIRAAIRQARDREDLGGRHFLQNERLRIFANSIVHVKKKGEAGPEVENLSHHGQYGISGVVKLYTKRIVKDATGTPLSLRLGQKPVRRLGYPLDVNPNVLSGRLVLAGTRIPLGVVVAERKEGKSIPALSRDFRISPSLIREALNYSDAKAA